MERARWTDERIDERMNSIDEKFDRIMDEMHAMRVEMRSGFAELRSEFRTELREEVGGVRGDLAAFQRHVTMIVAGSAIALIGVLGAVLAAG